MMVIRLKKIIHNILLKVNHRSSLSMSIKQPLSLKTKIITDSDSLIKLGERTSTFGSADLSSIAGGKLCIGADVAFNRNIIIICRNNITIEDKVIFGPNVVIYDHDHKFGSKGIIAAEYTKDEVVIEEGCWIGANVTILKGTKIGKESVIGAGTTVKGTIPAHSLVTSDRMLRIRPIEDR